MNKHLNKRPSGHWNSNSHNLELKKKRTQHAENGIGRKSLHQNIIRRKFWQSDPRWASWNNFSVYSTLVEFGFAIGICDFAKKSNSVRNSKDSYKLQLARITDDFWHASSSYSLCPWPDWTLNYWSPTRCRGFEKYIFQQIGFLYKNPSNRWGRNVWVVKIGTATNKRTSWWFSYNAHYSSVYKAT